MLTERHLEHVFLAELFQWLSAVCSGICIAFLCIVSQQLPAHENPVDAAVDWRHLPFMRVGIDLPGCKHHRVHA